MSSTDSLFTIALTRIVYTCPWYIVRGAGFVAVFLIILLMLSGIGLVTGHTFRWFEPTKAWAIHRAMGIALCVSMAVHILFLLIDHSLSFNFAQLFIPFISSYQTLWVGLGVLAMYCVVIVVASSLGWIDSKRGLWKKLHFVSYASMLLVFFHALNSGSDLKYGAFRSLWILLGGILLLAVVVRVFRSGTLKK